MAQLKQLARKIFQETLAAIDIPATMQRKLQRKGTVLLCGGTRIDLRDFEKLRVVAIGKAAHAMVEGLALVLAPFVRFEGVVSAPTAPHKPVPGMKYFVAGPPMAEGGGWEGAGGGFWPLKEWGGEELGVFFASRGGGARFEMGVGPAR